MNADFALSQWEFDILWSTMDTGPPPFPLRAAVHGETISEWERMRAEAMDDFRARGLLDSDHGAEALLGPLASPAQVIDVLGFIDGPLHAVASASRRDAVLATVAHGQVGLTRIRPTALVDSVVAVLPEVAAGSGRSITVRHADILRATSEDDEDNPLGDDSEEDAMLRVGIGKEDAARILEIAESRTSGGQIGVSVANRTGALRRASVLTSWFDTHAGRYLFVRDGEWISIMPADSARIGVRVQEILNSEVD